MGLQEERIVQLRVLRDEAKGIYNFGSGYVIAPGLVLTAAHVLEPVKDTPAHAGQRCEVRLHGLSTWAAGLVHWIDPALEVAVVLCAECPAPSAVSWGRVTGVRRVEWTAAGFPIASLHDGSRHVEQASGDAYPVGGTESGRLALTLRSRDAIDANQSSRWAGLSGAAVFCGDHLVGVIQSDPRTYATSLEARRVETFLGAPGLAALLGSPEWEDVRGDEAPTPTDVQPMPGALDPFAAVGATLREASRSQAPILIAVDEESAPLSDDQLSLSERHLTVTLSSDHAAAMVEIAGETLAATSLDEIVDAGRRIWTRLLAAESRLENLVECIEGSGVRQPVAWCGSPALLARLGPALQLAHAGRGTSERFVTVQAGAHYFFPVQDKRDSRNMAYRSGMAQPSVERRVFSDDDSNQRSGAVRDASAADIAVLVDPDPPSSATFELARLVRTDALARTRAVLAFVTELPEAEDTNALLDTLPFVSVGDVRLAEPALLTALEGALRDHAATFALPSIVAALRAAAVRQAVAADDAQGCLRALRWTTWSWVGLPLFASRYEEVPHAAYPHLMLLRSVASRDWYFNRRKEIPDAYAADTLSRCDLLDNQRFHLYLSGAGGTGKSCFLRYVHDELEKRDDAVGVWYRVDAPSSSWTSIERRVREETINAVRHAFDDASADEIAGLGGGLGDFLREAATRLRRTRPGLEIVVFIDQLERTFESGNEPDDVRLDEISSAVVSLLKTVGNRQGVRIFIASRKQYLPDFLGSSRTATDAGLEFNVLQKISDSTEQVGFVRRIVDWCRDNQLVDRTFSIDDGAALTLVHRADGNPLNTMLALIQLLSANPRGTVTDELLRTQYRPWEQSFDLDLRTAAHDDLDWYFLLAMAHAGTEIVSFDEVWWRLRMVDARLTNRVENLRAPRVIERLWLFGYLGRTLYARPFGDNPAGFLEFFHANLRDHIQRAVMARSGPAFGSTRRVLGTPAAWRALDRLAARAHDWAQTQQLLPPDDVRVLMEHRDQVIERHTLAGLQEPQPFALLFVRDPDPARKDLCTAASECFAFSALVHNDRGRWAIDRLFPDADSRIEMCERWLKSATLESRAALLRYLVGLGTQAANDLLVSIALGEEEHWEVDTARTLAATLTEPLYAAGYRNAFAVDLIKRAAERSIRRPDSALGPRARSFIAASCGGDRDALVRVLAHCTEWFTSDDSVVAKEAATMVNGAPASDWLRVPASETSFDAFARAAPTGLEGDVVLGLTVGENLRGAIDQDLLEAWSHELRRRLGVPFPDLRLTHGDTEPPRDPSRRDPAAPSAPDADAIGLWGLAGRISSDEFYPGSVRVLRRHWDTTGAPLPRGTNRVFESAGEDDVVWVPLPVDDENLYELPVKDFRAAVDDWLEHHARRSFEVLFDDRLLIELARDVNARSENRASVRGLDWRRFGRVITELVEEGVPFGARRDVVVEVVAGSAGDSVAPSLLAQKVREHLRADICRSVADEAGQMTVLLLEADLQEALVNLVRIEDEGALLDLEPADALRVVATVQRAVAEELDGLAAQPVIVTLPRLRRSLARLLHQFDHRIPVLSFTELVPDVITRSGEVIGSVDLLQARPSIPVDAEPELERA